MLLLAGSLGLGVYIGGRLGWLQRLDADTIDQLCMKVLLPLMFFFAFAINTHLSSQFGWNIAYVYAMIISLLFFSSFTVLSFIPALKNNRASHAFNMSSNHLVLVSAPLAGLLLGLDAMPIIVLGMLSQLVAVLLSVLLSCHTMSASLAILARYYGQTLWIWSAIVLGMMASYLPWNPEIREFFVDGFDWLCLCNTVFTNVLLSVKSLNIKHSLRESGAIYLSKVLLICLLVAMVAKYCSFDELQLSLMVIMLLSPGMMIKRSSEQEDTQVNQLWKQVIAGCNIWYMIMMLVVVLLPHLFV